MKYSTICPYDASVATPRSAKAVGLNYQLAQLAYGLHAALELHLHDTLEELDLTLPLADALWQLDPALGSLSRRDLAERLRCDPSNVTFLVDRLEQRQLISRERAAGDGRVKAIALTQSGIDVRTRLIATLAQSPMFIRLTNAQRRHLADLLQSCLHSDRPPG